MDKLTVGMVSLGCCKNQIDAERMLAKLSDSGFTISPDVSKCDAILVNTCGFIEAAKSEAIDTILEMAEFKSKRLKALIVTGCLAERYKQEIAEQMPEVDVVLGIGKNDDIVQVVQRALNGEKFCESAPKTCLSLEGKRILVNDPYFAYVKIAEGCSNCCTYCAIPMIRGPFRSRPIENILEEIDGLVENGCKEINIVAQDTSRYGEDLYGEGKLPELLERICQIPGDFWVRILYCYPERITDKLLQTIASQPKMCHYLDIPLQHASEHVLKDMNRQGSHKSLLNLVGHIRSLIPDVCLRTTLLTGFPTETEDDFSDLCLFVEEALFDRLGCFAYSQEEGTKAATYPQIDEDIRKRRAEIIMELQGNVAFDLTSAKIGSTQRVLVEGLEDDHYVGRTYCDAPDVDPKVYFNSKITLYPGDFVDVVITDTGDYDLFGISLEDYQEISEQGESNDEYAQ